MSERQPTFEESLKALESIADRIERGEVGLEESITLYEQGMKLVNQCRTTLERAEQRIKSLQSASADVPMVPPNDSLASA